MFLNELLMPVILSISVPHCLLPVHFRYFVCVSHFFARFGFLCLVCIFGTGILFCCFLKFSFFIIIIVFLNMYYLLVLSCYVYF